MDVALRSFARSRALAVAAGMAAVALLACRDDPTSGPVPAVIELTSQDVTEAPVGSTVTPAPTFIVTDGNGRIVAGVPVRIRVIEGDGEVRNAPTHSGQTPTPIGDWLLGGTAGVHSVSVSVGRLPPLILTVNALPDAPAGIEITQGGGQSALAGALLSQPIDLRVRDRFGNGTPGVTVTLSLESGGGLVSPTTVVTDASGMARGIAWRLGTQGGPQRVKATAGDISIPLTAAVRSDFSVDLRFFGTPPDESVQELFRRAVDRIEASVVGDLPDVPLFSFDLGRCGVPLPALTETIDDMLILATVGLIDGPGRVLGSAGPCVTRTESRFTLIGVIRFDIDDIGDLLEDGSFGDVILHELLHIVGVGPQWRSKGMIVGSGTEDPRFIGSRAAIHCQAAGGGTACGSGTVPVENSGGGGTAEVHWRESVFDDELMTGFVEVGRPMPLSAMTLGSIEDLGLAVNHLAADAYFIAASVRASPQSVAPLMLWEQLDAPRYEISPGGWVRPVTKEKEK
ncbi:MAG TPA: leishmanolysin-related zinc metalloendopeptidase [Gemmatimonadaceae bacterium]